MKNTDAIAAKNNSYKVRRELTDLTGTPSSYLPKNWLVDVTLADGTEIDAILLSTMNAGERGIEGRFEMADGTRITRSLGYITNPAA